MHRVILFVQLQAFRKASWLKVELLGIAATHASALHSRLSGLRAQTLPAADSWRFRHGTRERRLGMNILGGLYFSRAAAHAQQRISCSRMGVAWVIVVSQRTDHWYSFRARATCASESAIPSPALRQAPPAHACSFLAALSRLPKRNALYYRYICTPPLPFVNKYSVAALTTVPGTVIQYQLPGFHNMPGSARVLCSILFCFCFVY